MMKVRGSTPQLRMIHEPWFIMNDYGFWHIMYMYYTCIQLYLIYFITHNVYIETLVFIKTVAYIVILICINIYYIILYLYKYKL